MTPQELKSSILQLAIQGKLVEQRPEEGTAEELYRQIQEEKRRLIQEGKIKKEKPLPEITEGEVPFEIPESWKWVHIRDIALLNPKNSLKDDLKVSFIPMALISGGFQNSHSHEIRQWKEIQKGFTHFADGDVGIAKITPCFQNRKSVVFSKLQNGYGAGTTELSIVRVVGDLLLREYLLYFFKSAYFIENGIKSFTGTAGQQRIHKDYLPLCLFPLPPLDEQERIVSKIEELLPYIDRYEQAWSCLEEFNKRFPVDMRKSLLQWTIQGKLVEQRPEEGTAEELYRQIQEEKRRLVKEGKIKKEKPLPEIAEAEVPFEIPDSWKWVRLSQISVLENGDRSSKYPVERDYVDFGIPFFGAKDMNGFAMSFDNVRYISEEKFSELGNGKLKDKDFVCLLRGSVGKCAVFTADEQHKTGFICAQMVIIRSINPAVCNYLQIYLSSPCYFQYIESKITGTAVRQLPAKELGSVLIPLPPLSEQKRIVAKLEELLPLCERLK